ncbi:MAG TPA: VOC family protein [Steroidobacteraceae bacterium]|nr:VOC family protein [Steroidobacteraceae bacterium]
MFPLTVLVCLYAAAACLARAASLELPPINAAPSAEHHVGKVIWADLITPDLAVAERFYGGLFGWTFQPIHGGSGDYAVAMAGGRPVGGLFQKALPSGERRQSAWLTFISVRDLDAAKRVALAHGAKILLDARNVPARGRQAVLSDPEGAVFAMLASSSGDPPDYLADPGEWIWSSLLCGDPGTEAAFYQTVFGYEVFDLASDDQREHIILSSDDLARASANSRPSDSAATHPHWLNFVRVADAADAAGKAVALGGRVLVEPHVGRHGGRVAVVADPLGAAVGVMEWSEAAGQAAPQ